jgi:hypothetical protein
VGSRFGVGGRGWTYDDENQVSRRFWGGIHRSLVFMALHYRYQDCTGIVQVSTGYLSGDELW